MFLFICLTVHFTCSMGYQPCWNAIPSREIPKNMPTHQTPWNMFFISFMFIRLRDYHDYAVFSPEPSLYPHQCNQHQDFLCPTKSGDSFTEPKWVEHLPLPFPLELPCDPGIKTRVYCVHWHELKVYTDNHLETLLFGYLSKQEISSSTLSLQCIGSQVDLAPLTQWHMQRLNQPEW